MLIDNNTTVALRCPRCGDIDYEGLSIFDFSGKKKHEIICSCGFTKAVVGTRDLEKFWLKINCLVCAKQHVLYYSKWELWSEKITLVNCPDSELTWGYLGCQQGIEELVEERGECFSLMLDQMDFDDYFSNPEIMLATLDIIHDIAEEGKLFCQCGNYEIDITMYADKLELICRECHGLVMINASTESNINSLRKIDYLLLPESEIEALDPEG